MIGLGYHGTITPGVIRRNVLESPAWYTAYTPYQPEISQGRLEALLNFQTMVSDLTGLDTANASLLDESTAVAEAVTLMRRRTDVESNRVVVDADCLPQTIAVLDTRLEPARDRASTWSTSTHGLPDGDFFGVVQQYPGCSGAIRDFAALTDGGARQRRAGDGGRRPAGADAAEAAGGVGRRRRRSGPRSASACRSGTEGRTPPSWRSRQGSSGTCRDAWSGLSIDAEDRPAYRLALQTREQHIRREKATSNICTAQVLLAVVASMYAVYHGAEGLRGIARRVHGRTLDRGRGARRRRASTSSTDEFFDTRGRADTGAGRGDRGRRAPSAACSSAWSTTTTSGISCGETTTAAHVAAVLEAFGVASSGGADAEPGHGTARGARCAAGPILSHPVFSEHHSETAMLRYLRRLSDRDFALDRGMIPLGSCTMKLNATTEMEPVGAARASPTSIRSRRSRARRATCRSSTTSKTWLARVTGYAKVSVQPNAGSQGELAGLLAIRAYHRSRGEARRDVCLIPSSAHGTNAASAVMAGMRVVVVAALDDGTVDLDDLRAKCEEHGDRLAAIMVTYPSTHGVYEEGIGDMCALVHEHGGQVYIDGANLNALLGLAEPGHFGGDVSHLNLHKTFCIPHGGGGPGVGPVAVAEHLVPFLPSHPMHPRPEQRDGIGPVSAAPFGSAGILAISWAYIRLLSGAGLAHATKSAVLAANYVAARLAPSFPILYTGKNGLVAHECILDLRPLTKATGVTVDDVAKRLIDYGFHAPTVSFPVAGTLMVEPTESEDLAELDRFCDAMIAIRAEIDEVAAGRWSIEDSPLRGAPHTAAALVVGVGATLRPADGGLSRRGRRRRSTGRPVARINQAYGDRNLMCTCPPPEAFAS